MNIRQLADDIQALEFDTVFRVAPGGEVIPCDRDDNEYAPSVYNDPDDDVYLDDSRWDCFTGLTTQDSYRGAVMHSSEQVGTSIAECILDYASECDDCLFALVTVNDLDDDDIIGWAIVHREITKETE